MPCDFYRLCVRTEIPKEGLILRDRISRRIRGLPVSELIETQEHFVELVKTVNDQIDSDLNISSAAIDLKKRLEDSDTLYGNERKRLLVQLRQFLPPADAELTIRLLDYVKWAIEEQIAFIEFQRENQKQVAALHEMLWRPVK